MIRLLVIAATLALCGCQSAQPQTAPRAASTEVAPSQDLSSGDQAAGMAGEDAEALRLRPASQPAPQRHRRPRPAGGRRGW